LDSQERNKNSNLVGDNRLQALLFGLGTNQLFGINIFKVKEVLHKPKINKMIKSNPLVLGVSIIRNQTIPVIDIKAAIGMKSFDNNSNKLIILVEYSKTTLAFLVDSVDVIVNMSWEDVEQVPKSSGVNHYLTAVAKHKDKMISILDVEKILDQIIPNKTTSVSQRIIDGIPKNNDKPSKIMVVDDSSVATNQIQKCLSSAGLETECFSDGKKALKHLLELVDIGVNPSERYAMVVSDIEMPIMDGYTLTSEIKSNSNIKDLPIILHTSLSGVFNEALVKKVGANKFVSKFSPDELGNAVLEQIKQNNCLLMA
jgi:two-component system chemotaxis response regulator CheV